MGFPCPCGVDDISALRKQPLSVSATSVRPKPGDLGVHEDMINDVVCVQEVSTVYIYNLLRFIKILGAFVRYSLSRVGSFHVVRIDIDIWKKLVEDASG